MEEGKKERRIVRNARYSWSTVLGNQGKKGAGNRESMQRGKVQAEGGRVDKKMKMAGNSSLKKAGVGVTSW